MTAAPLDRQVEADWSIESLFPDGEVSVALLSLIESMPGVSFFAKNAEGSLIYANQLLLENLRVEKLEDLVGLKDSDFLPKETCDCFARDDQRVLTKGETIKDRIELGFTGKYILEWHTTTKIPVFNKQGDVIGLIGITKPCEDEPAVSRKIETDELGSLIDWLLENQNRKVTSKEMAEQCGLSVWQLRRRIEETYGTTPQDFELASRIRAASQALKGTSKTISEIAFEFGYSSQSSFSFQFKKRIGYSPKEYREISNG